MSIDIKTLSVEPKRQTFAHIARRFGADRPASRYEEGTLDVQATDHFHYRPLWNQDFELYDERRTQIRMADWYALKDPRQYYYATYNIARATMHQATERAFGFVEKRQLLDQLSPDWRTKVETYLLPLRHAEWGANMNATTIAEAGYGTAVTSASIFSAGDHLAMAQFISRIGLVLDGGTGAALDQAKDRWMNAPEWQGVRRLVEDTLVVSDWFELFVAQNLVIDGLTHPLVYGHFDAAGQSQGGAGISMLTEFMADWFAEHSRWADAVIKTAAAESPENAALLSGWYRDWAARAADAFRPLAEAVLGAAAEAAMSDVTAKLAKRAAGLGLAV